MSEDLIRQLENLRKGFEKTSLEILGQRAPRALARLNPVTSAVEAMTFDVDSELLHNKQFILIIDALIHILMKQPPDDQVVAIKHFITELDPFGYLNLTTNARRVCQWVAKQSEYGYAIGKPIFGTSISQEPGFQMAEIQEALDELDVNGYISLTSMCNHCDSFIDENLLYWAADAEVKEWDTLRNAEELAVKLVNHDDNAVWLESFCEILGWPKRKLNPAVTFLVENNKADGDQPCTSTYVPYSFLYETSATRQFVKYINSQNEKP